MASEIFGGFREREKRGFRERKREGGYGDV